VSFYAEHIESLQVIAFNFYIFWGKTRSQGDRIQLFLFFSGKNVKPSCSCKRNDWIVTGKCLAIPIQNPGTNPTIASYNASVVIFYNA
jgi:hypothetical protein